MTSFPSVRGRGRYPAGGSNVYPDKIGAKGHYRNTGDPFPPPIPPVATGLVAWYQAPSSPGGTKIDTLPDLSGVTGPATQPTDFQRPVVVASALDGRPAMQFGTLKFFAIPRITLNNFCIYAVVNTDSQGTLLGTDDASNTVFTDLRAYKNESGQLSAYLSSGPDVISNDGGSALVGQPTLMTWNRAIPNIDFSINKTSLGSFVGPVGSTDINMFGNCRINFITRFGYFLGQVMEVLIYNTAHTTERASVVTYLKGRYPSLDI